LLADHRQLLIALVDQPGRFFQALGALAGLGPRRRQLRLPLPELLPGVIEILVELAGLLAGSLEGLLALGEDPRGLLQPAPASGGLGARALQVGLRGVELGAEAIDLLLELALLEPQLLQLLAEGADPTFEPPDLRRPRVVLRAQGRQLGLAIDADPRLLLQA